MAARQLGRPEGDEGGMAKMQRLIEQQQALIEDLRDESNALKVVVVSYERRLTRIEHFFGMQGEV